jgi:glutathione synthase
MSELHLGIVMDPISRITPAKDSSLTMLLEAQKRGWRISYFELGDLRISNGEARGKARPITVKDDNNQWFELGQQTDMPLADLDVLLMRKDPPFDMEYIYATYVLELAEALGVLVVNKPQSLRDMNEKAFTAWFPQCCPDTLITRSMTDMREFLNKHGRAVVKPLHGMGGQSIFVIQQGDLNANVIFETLTQYESRFAMCQGYIPEIKQGDKRIILIGGEPVEKVVARVPSADDNRGNLVAGAKPDIRPLTDRDRWICDQVGPVLRDRGIIFAGIDVIGDYLTEVNVTSPTGIRELRKYGDIDAAAMLMSYIASLIELRNAAS